MNVLIGFDSMAASGYIFDDLKSAGLPADVRFHIVSATDLANLEDDASNVTSAWRSQIPEGERDYLDSMLENARRVAASRYSELSHEATRAVERLNHHFPQSEVSYIIHQASPWEAITREAKALPAHLIVVGSQNAAGLSRVFLGSVSQKVVSYAEQSVRIARAQANPTDHPPRVIVAVDGSEDSHRAVEAVAARNWPAGTQVKAVAVVEEKLINRLLANLNSISGGHLFAGDKDAADHARLAASLAETAASRLRDAGLAAEAVGLQGDPKGELLELAESWNAQAIFLGAHGKARQEGEPLGAVVSALATRSGCSLEVVRG